MAGYILAKFFFTRVYEPGRRLGTQTRKIKRTRAISGHLHRTSLVNKGFVIWSKEKNLRDTAGNPEQAD